MITFIDLFAGIGGFRLGIERASDKLNIPVKCVFSSEIDKNARIIYEKNFKEVPSGDITKIQANNIQDFQVLCGGFPCQAFSIAGKRGGFEDTRGTLFFDIARIIKEKRPKLLFLENVKGLLNHNKGRTFATILITLDELGYDAEWQVLNSKDFEVPQNRERVFIIGHLRGVRTRQIFPITGQGNPYTTVEKSTETAVARTLTAGGHSGGNHSGMTIIKECRAVLTPDRLEKRQNGRRIKNTDEPMFTLTTQDKHGVLIGSDIRRLTPIECERLQSYPDNYTEGISDSARYKCLGNSVTVNVIQAIAEKILLSLR